MLMAGGTARTQNYKFAFYWPTVGDARDFNTFSTVGKWIGQNARILDRKTATEATKLVTDQFPDLVAIEAAHANGPVARWVA